MSLIQLFDLFEWTANELIDWAALELSWLEWMNCGLWICCWRLIQIDSMRQNTLNLNSIQQIQDNRNSTFSLVSEFIKFTVIITCLCLLACIQFNLQSANGINDACNLQIRLNELSKPGIIHFISRVKFSFNPHFIRFHSRTLLFWHHSISWMKLHSAFSLFNHGFSLIIRKSGHHLFNFGLLSCWPG